MFTGMEWMACQNLAVAADVMQHVVQVESSANPYAIGVVGGRLLRQPHSLDEALATVRMLDSGHYNYALGLAQVSRTNLRRYGLDSYQQAFSACPNLAAGAQILAECRARAGGNWGNAFSCYYSGDFVTGYRDGYVRKVYASIQHGAEAHADATRTDRQQASHKPRRADTKQSAPTSSDSPAYRIAMRSVTVQAAAAGVVAAAGTTLADRADDVPSTRPPGVPAAPASDGEPVAVQSSAAATEASADAIAAAVVVPRVSGPDAVRPGTVATATTAAPASSHPSGPAVDRADLRKEHSDAAFVF